MLLGLLALSFVLLDGITIKVNQVLANAQQGREAALGQCFNVHDKFPRDCIVNQVYRCDKTYIIRTDCLGVGDVILNNQGEYQNWCGYTALDGAQPQCGQYLIDEAGRDCLAGKNLCLKL
ncbi:hypothetical protein KKF61_03245 [Patescibacteria group bacterium]|nr:hypothetical protein [Patescibacteria group bacterium]MBU0964224.1 hypothetical protein [Patescibacteria group bacterium]